MSKQTDKNFDPIAQKFVKNIYGTTKGEIRVAVLWRDLMSQIPALQAGKPLRILDAGGGFGYFSQKLAALGHEIVLCDISQELLDIAQQQIAASDTPLHIQLLHCSIQELSVTELGQFDLVLCHAVAEWLEDAETTIAGLLPFLKPEAYLSLMFFNLEAMRFHALVSGNFDYVRADFKIKKKVRLTPTYPLTPTQVEQWYQQWGLSLPVRSGVRVINDYLKKSLPPEFSTADLLEMELAYSQHPSYRDLGRYVHFLGQAPVC